MLSGTHATIEQRVAVIESLLASADEKRRALGVLALKAVLEAWHFLAVGTFDFGARPRNFGYWPRTEAEVQHWFSRALRLVETIACGTGPLAQQGRAALAERLFGLWFRGGGPDEIVRVCRSISTIHFWPEGWLAVRQILGLDGKGLDEENRAKLIDLESALRPINLKQKVRAIVFSPRVLNVDLDDFEDQSADDFETRMARTEALARDLGKAVATDDASLAALLPEIVAGDGRLWFFGQGLFLGTTDPVQLWNRLVGALEATDASARKPQVLRGYLQQLRATNPALATGLLDNSVDHELLGESYPFLQVAVDLEDADVTRLKRSVALGRAPAGMYVHLAFGRAADPIPPADFQELTLDIADMPSGYDVAVEILYMRLHSYASGGQAVAPEIVDTGCELLQQFTFSHSDRQDHRLGELIKACLKSEKGALVVTSMCQRLKNAVGNHETSAFYHDDLLLGMLTSQPTATLDGLCGGDEKELELGVRILRDVGHRKHPLAAVPDKDLVIWCDQEPQARYTALADIIMTVERPGGNAPPRWTSIARRFLESAPDPSAILREFVTRFVPLGGWSGSLAAILTSNAPLLDQLDAFPALRATVAEQKEQLRKWIEETQRRETAFGRQQDERFE